MWAETTLENKSKVNEYAGLAPVESALCTGGRMSTTEVRIQNLICHSTHLKTDMFPFRGVNISFWSNICKSLNQGKEGA